MLAGGDRVRDKGKWGVWIVLAESPTGATFAESG